jgi:hypothetical protein
MTQKVYDPKRCNKKAFEIINKMSHIANNNCSASIEKIQI